MLDTPPSLPAARRPETLRQIQRFLNLWHDMIGLPGPLPITGELDEATCQALARVTAITRNRGRFTLPDATSGTDQSLQAFAARAASYSRPVAQLLEESTRPMDAAHRKQWWSVLQQVLHQHYPSLRHPLQETSPAPAAHITHALIEYFHTPLRDAGADQARRNALGWAYRNRRDLPAPLAEAIFHSFPVRPDMEDAATLVNHPFPSVWAPGKIITYAFSLPGPSENAYHTNRTPAPMSLAGKALFRESLAELEAMANIRFLEVSPDKRCDYRVFVDDMRAKSDKAPFAGIVPPRKPGQGVIVFNAETGQTLPRYDEARYFMMHEAGHAADLMHTQSTLTRNTKHLHNGRPVETITVLKHPLAEPLDNLDHSIMSYFHRPNQPRPDSPMVLDAMALQRLYGPNNATRSGHTHYSIAPDAGPKRIRRTLVDAAGCDELDAGNARGDVTLDLRPGYLTPSDIDGHEIWIAPGSRIEAARGGQGKDLLIVGQGGGTLSGGAGRDTFRVLGNGHSRITDFTAGESLELSAELARQRISLAPTPQGVRLRAESNFLQPNLVLDIEGPDRAAIIRAVEQALPPSARANLRGLGFESTTPAKVPDFTECTELRPSRLPVTKKAMRQ